jgi:hypothetical protein
MTKEGSSPHLDEKWMIMIIGNTIRLDERWMITTTTKDNIHHPDDNQTAMTSGTIHRQDVSQRTMMHVNVSHDLVHLCTTLRTNLRVRMTESGCEDLAEHLQERS